MRIFLLLFTFFFAFPAFAADTLRVRTPDEFVKAIGPERVIVFDCDTIQLREIAELKALEPGRPGEYPILLPYVQYIGGNGVVIKNVNGLQLIGKKSGTVICTSDIQNTIMTFRRCARLSISGIEFNHLPKSLYNCEGGVVFLDQCSSVKIDRCKLIGSGTFGLLLANDTNLRCTNTLITECSQLLFEVYGSVDLAFEKCTFSQITASSGLLHVTNVKNMQFTACLFEKNRIDTEDGYYEKGRNYVFYFYADETSTGFLLRRCEFRDNAVEMLTNKKEVFIFEGCAYKGNEQLKASESKQ